MDIRSLLLQQMPKHECVRCGEALESNSRFIQHSLGHIGVFIHLCPYCDKLFHDTNELTQHLAEHGKGSQVDEKKRRRGRKSRIYDCLDCGKKFNRKAQFDRHTDIHAGNKFMCEQCGKLFSQKGYLKVHQEIHSGEKSYRCDVCGREFAQKSTLVHHETVHTGKRFDCKDCGKVFSRKSYLSYHEKTHLIATLEDLKRFKCEECERFFTHKGDLTQHVRSIHRGIKFACEECGKEFTKKSNLTKHVKIHEDVD